MNLEQPMEKTMKPLLLSKRGVRWVVTFGLLMATARSVTAAEMPRTFASPEEAVAMLATAVKAKDFTAVRALFGADADALVNPDPVLATNEFATLATALAETNRVVRETGTRCVLEAGHDLWPFPVPLVQKEGRWLFDTAAGHEELLNRRIGRNELAALKVVRAHVQAQREYASRDHDHDEVLEYAQNILSTPGRKDGLYWSPQLDGEISPIGPLVAAAQAEGYRKSTGEKSGPQPFHGYHFKILTRQGKAAPGGKHSYIINGNMIGGFALVAWPADYGESGIMTFIINQQGRAYQKDFGAGTAKTTEAMKEYDPNKTWSVSQQ